MQYIDTDRQFYVKLLKITIPVAAQSVITTGVNLVDTIMLGQLTETALSASSLANQFIMLYVFLMMGMSMGASVLVSRFFGARDMTSLKCTITISIRVGMIIALLFTLANVLLPEQIMNVYIKDADVIEAGATYLRWSTITYILVCFSTTLTNIMRSASISHVPFIASCCAFVVNIGANYAFIFGKLGMPQMGIAGAALGTVIARVLETGIICGYFFIRDRVIHFRVGDLLCKCGGLLRQFIIIALPVLLSDGLLGIGDNILAIIMGNIGSEFVSANAITNVVQRVSTVLITGLSFSGCFIIGQTLGEGDIQRVRKQGNTFLLLGLVFGLLAAIVIKCLSAPIVDAYNIMPETRDISLQFMDAICLIIICRTINSILTKGVLRGGGDTRFLLVADTTTLWLVAVPLGALAGLVFHLSPFWIYICLRSDQIIKAIWCVLRLRSNKWIKKIRGLENVNA